MWQALQKNLEPCWQHENIDKTYRHSDRQRAILGVIYLKLVRHERMHEGTGIHEVLRHPDSEGSVGGKVSRKLWSMRLSTRAENSADGNFLRESWFKGCQIIHRFKEARFICINIHYNGDRANIWIALESEGFGFLCM